MSLVLPPAPAVAELLARAAQCQRSPSGGAVDGELHCGVDLGTATIVLAVTDDGDRPIYVDSVPSDAIREGVVVDFHSAVDAVVKMRHRAEQSLDQPITAAATAYPPGVGRSESRACQFVLERAGLSCVKLLDEVSAANALLGVRDGIVVDVGGGSTGVGVLVSGELVSVGDLPGGGHHLDLILAGALHIPVQDAEQLKREHGQEYVHILRPGLERVASSIQRLSAGFEHLLVHLVGGALMIPGAAEIVADYLGVPVVEYPDALFITPLGIARSAR